MKGYVKHLQECHNFEGMSLSYINDCQLTHLCRILNIFPMQWRQ